MTSSSAIERKLKREIAARKAAESLLEEKSLELFNANQQLEVALKQVEQRSEASFKRLEFQQHIERILIHFGRTFLRSNLDDVLLSDLIKQLSEAAEGIYYCIELTNDLIPTLTNNRFKSSIQIDENSDIPMLKASIPIQVEQENVGTLKVMLIEEDFDLAFIESQMSLVCELLSSSITRQLINLRLVKSKERAEASERSTREFLAMINHELRTPLNGLLGSVELLADTDLKGAQQELHTNLSQSGQLLRSIINDLLDFSKIDAGMLELIDSTFKWTNLQSTLCSIFEHKAAEKQIGFTVCSEGFENKRLKGDLERLTQIFVNLIGNAIKFTDEGSVKVTVSLKDKGFDFSVADTGIGISQTAQKKLFQPFTQADRSSSRNYEGTGLGLAICKRLVELMGGSISLKSEVGEGTTFFGFLPVGIEEVDEKERVQQNLDIIAQDFSALKVLVVDDIKMNQVVITKMLSKVGITPDLAVNGLEAVEHATNQQYDIIFMDCRMPVMDGFEATKRLRDASYAKPIVALTAGTTREERQTCYDVGMDDILSKPYTAKDLTLTLSKWGPSSGLDAL
ncbi:ATP-binding protein [Vibrio mediterranei]|uniref:ATP-binding protein n=1 Tax=Vibrio TaxID=662 RepID=UPI001EFC547A|nr:MULTISPECIES: ATP-binding protein [Vibrio]MCF4172627.1 ATP-binding protein [Vibrio sp. McD22-P3]MCG9661973.1 ATP-binding protein [Vibrio mediterranei]